MTPKLKTWWRSRRPAAVRVTARPRVEALEERCLPAARSVIVNVINNTGSALIRDGGELDHGEWTNGVIPPGRIEVGQTVSWESESDGFLTGTEGRAIYRVEGTPEGTPWTFTLHWDNPFIGSNSYDETEPVGFSASHAGGSGDNATVTWTLGIVDSSGDGIPDAWKTNGIDYNGDGTIDFKPANATVGRKDVYVEVDAMAGRAPAQSTLNAVVTAFANAPVTNPDGSTGVTLHLDLDDTNIPLANWGSPPTSNSPWPNFDAAKPLWFGTAAERADPNAANILGAKALIYRYCIFANNQGTSTSSGLSEIGGNDFMVTLGLWATPGGTVQQQEGTFMHELGHTLGLQHGGGDSINNKPNYNSVMNYTWQTPQSWMSVDPNGNATASIWTLDYSHVALPTLNETSLDETKGIQGTPGLWVQAGPKGSVTSVFETGPVDWNGNGDGGTQTSVSADVNFDGSSSEVLTGYDDWSNLVYNFRSSPKFLAGNHGTDDTDTEEELTYETFQALDDQTSTQVISSLSPSTYGQTVSLTATVIGLNGTTPAGGSVQFFDGGTPIGSAPLSGGTATISLTTLTAGSHSITADYGGFQAYQASNSSAFTQTVNQAPLTVTAGDASRTYGDPNPAFTGSIVGLQNNDNITAVYTTTATQGSDVGTYPITPTLVDPDGRLGNYSVTLNDGTLTITKAHLTVTADDLTKIFRAPNPTLTATITGFVLGQTLATSGVTGAPDLSTTATQNSPVGTYPITVGPGTLAAKNYDFTSFVPGTLSVTYAINVQFDQDHAKNSNATIPIKIQLADAFGNNVSSSSVGVHALYIAPASDPSDHLPPDSPGNSQPGNDFRFTGGSYQYNFKQKGLEPGLYFFYFAVDGDPLVHSVHFIID